MCTAIHWMEPSPAIGYQVSVTALNSLDPQIPRESPSSHEGALYCSAQGSMATFLRHAQLAGTAKECYAAQISSTEPCADWHKRPLMDEHNLLTISNMHAR